MFTGNFWPFHSCSSAIQLSLARVGSGFREDDELDALMIGMSSSLRLSGGGEAGEGGISLVSAPGCIILEEED